MNPFQFLLQQSGRILPQAARAAQGFARSILPQRAPEAARAFSLRAGPNAPVMPLDNPLQRLQGNIRYYQRQLNTVMPGVINRIPTAINPFATREPTTFLGRTGKFLNPLSPSPMSLGGSWARTLINPAPGVATGMNLGTNLASRLGVTGLGLGAAGTGGGILAAIGGDMLFPRPTAEGTLDAARRGEFISSPQEIGTRDERGRYFAGHNYGFQSPESFNKLYGTRLPTVRSTPPEEAASSTWEDSFDSGGFTSDVSVPPAVASGSRPPTPQPAATTTPAVLQQAGQVVDLPPPPNSMFGQVVISNGAGVPAQRQNVQQRALSQEVLNAAQQYSAPANIPISSFYAGQQQLGRSMQQTGELQRRLMEEGGASGMTEEALAQWVRANPGLAYRELMKLQENR